MDRKHYYQLVGQLKEVDVTSPKTVEDVDNNDALTMETYLDSSARTCVKIAQVHPLNYQQGTAHVWLTSDSNDEQEILRDSMKRGSQHTVIYLHVQSWLTILSS